MEKGIRRAAAYANVQPRAASIRGHQPSLAPGKLRMTRCSSRMVERDSLPRRMRRSA